MRRSVLLFGIACTLALTYLLYAFSTLISLLLEDYAEDAIHRSELPAQNSTLIDTRPQLIPKIIHQTYKNETIPSVWRDAQKSCISLHDDYEYILWTDAKSVDFIAREYPWFLETFTGYEYPIQRADTIRYFVLAHYGGIYIDLDDGCNRRLDPLLSYPAWLRRTSPTGISNDAMGSVPQHPFFLHVIDSLQAYNRHWVLPYITVMYSTGPLFLSVIWKQWMGSRSSNDSDRVRVLMKDEYNRFSWSFFTYHKGSSWHGKDAQLIFWMGQNWILLTMVGTALVLGVGFLLYKCYSRVVAINGCSALPWPFSKIAAAWRRPDTKNRDQYYFHRAPSQEYDDAEFSSKLPDGDDYHHGHGRRRSLVASAAQSQQQSYYSEKQDANMVNSMTYALTPTHSNLSSSSTVISEAPTEYEAPIYASQDHLAPATATNAYPTHIERSPSSRLQLPTLSSFLPRRLGRSRDPSPAARPHSSGDARSGCGLTGEDVEAQTTLTRQLSYQGEQSGPIDMRETWARDDARRQR